MHKYFLKIYLDYVNNLMQKSRQLIFFKLALFFHTLHHQILRTASSNAGNLYRRNAAVSRAFCSEREFG